MKINQHLTRAENIKAIQALHHAGVDHHVIAVFMQSEGILVNAPDIDVILNRFTALGQKKLASKKIQALIQAKHLVEEDESLPCPAYY